MPVEIRELVIKTKITSRVVPEPPSALSPQVLAALKQQIMQACLKQLKQETRRNNFDR